jgi:predicted dinucleotide-binding enzyme
MKIAIIGTGNVGAALATAFARAGHAVTLGTRNPGKAGPLAAATGATLASPEAAAAGAEVVILALPWAAAAEAVAGLGDLAGRIVIDAMNPLAMIEGRLDLDRGQGTSGAETVATWLPGARVIKTLNQVGAEIMADNARMAHRPAMFMAGDDDAAKHTVAGLLSDIGFQPFDAGGLVRARLLEPLAMVWINQAMLRGAGRAWALAALPQS